MSWAGQRQLSVILLILGALFILGVLFFWLFIYKPPSCFDGIANADERGIDCGGACDLVCPLDVAEVSVLWSRAMPVTGQVYNALAMVRNPNPDSGTSALEYSFSLYDSNNLLIAERRGQTFIAPGETAPIFEPSIIVGERIPSRAFITFTGTPAFVYSTPKPKTLPVSDIVVETAQAPKVTARIKNPEFNDAHSISVIAIVYDGQEVAIAASQTVIDVLPGRGERIVTFTWPQAFPAEPGRVDVIPRVMPESGR